jgi:predicted nucleic acid-binding protein
MVLLDTNILSEIIRPAPAPAVLHWLATQPVASVFISAVTEAPLDRCIRRAFVLQNNHGSAGNHRSVA